VTSINFFWKCEKERNSSSSLGFGYKFRKYRCLVVIWTLGGVKWNRETKNWIVELLGSGGRGEWMKNPDIESTVKREKRERDFLIIWCYFQDGAMIIFVTHPKENENVFFAPIFFFFGVRQAHSHFFISTFYCLGLVKIYIIGFFKRILLPLLKYFILW